MCLKGSIERIFITACGEMDLRVKRCLSAAEEAVLWECVKVSNFQIFPDNSFIKPPISSLFSNKWKSTKALGLLFKSGK